MTDALDRLAAEKLAAMPSWALPALGVGLTGALGGAALTHTVDRAAEKTRRQRSNNVAFGAGLAGGVAAPRALGRLVQIGRANGLVEEP